MNLGFTNVVAQLGVMLALIAAALYGVGTMTARKALIGTDTLTGSMVTVVVGLPILLVASAASGEFSKLAEMTTASFITLGLAGLANFFVGRLVMFNAMKLVGANRTHALTSTAPVYASLLALLFLRESVTILTVAAIVTIVFGASLLSSSSNNGGSFKVGGEEFKRGVAMAVFAGFLFGLAHFFTGFGVESVLLPITGATVSYGFAALGYLALVTLDPRIRRAPMAQADFRSTLKPFALPGIFNGLAQIFSYSAFAVSPVVFVSPVLSTQSLFTVLFSYLLIRKLEVFHASVIAGALLVVVGVAVLSLPGLP